MLTADQSPHTSILTNILETMMGRRSIVEKNRVYIECTDAHRKVKAHIIKQDERTIKVELPTGFVMELEKKHRRGAYRFQCGMLEFVSDGKPVV